MDSFFALFITNSELDTAPEPSTPIEADGIGTGTGGCIVA